MKSASFTTKDVKNCCENKLGIEFRGKKHFNGWYYLDNKKAARITVSMGKKGIPPKTYKTMAKQLNLNVEQFDELLECPLEKEGYDHILRLLLASNSKLT